MSTRNGVLARGFVNTINTPTLVGTVPSTDTWILKDVSATNLSGAGLDVFIDVKNAAGTIVNRIVGGFLANNSRLAFVGALCAAPGDQVVCTIDAGSVSVWVSGADLMGHL